MLENPGKPLYPYGTTTPLPIIGRFSCKISTNTKSVDTTCDVIRGSHRSLLSKATSVSLGLMQIADDQARVHAISDTGDSELNHILNKYDNCFEGLGKLKDYQLKIHIDENIPPIAQNVLCVPFHVRHQVDEKLDELLNLDVIEPVEGPTPWVSPLVVVPKANKGIRLCLDMRCANEAVKRERHTIPTVDEILQEMSAARVISKLDLTMGYHQIELDEKLQIITTFVTHRRLYRYKRLVFGISSASEIY